MKNILILLIVFTFCSFNTDTLTLKVSMECHRNFMGSKLEYSLEVNSNEKQNLYYRIEAPDGKVLVNRVLEYQSNSGYVNSNYLHHKKGDYKLIIDRKEKDPVIVKLPAKPKHSEIMMSVEL